MSHRSKSLYFLLLFDNFEKLIHTEINIFLFQINRSAKKRLFQVDDLNGSLSSNYSSLQKTRSNATTLERSDSKSPRPITQKPDRTKKLPKTQMSPEQLKAQLEQKILEDHKQNLKNKNDMPMKIVAETQKTENNFQKFGIRVLPTEQLQQKSPKIAELSQNDNNINIERFKDDSRIIEPMSIDEVDDNKKRQKPAISPKMSPENGKDSFVRQSSINGSGIKRDANGIPQEIPNHMFNAAVAARKNRKGSVDHSLEKDDEGPKTPKKQKGKAPAPPEEKSRGSSPEKAYSNASLDQIEPFQDTKVNKSDDSIEKQQNLQSSSPVKQIKDYNSDSDVEIDNQSSVNTIELNSSDITIHQSEENDELQNRKTASTGDLTKIHRTNKSNSGTLERAQSLDITDTGIPALSKKRKAAKIEDIFDSRTNSDDSLYGNALLKKEPRLSLILDGLNTFQRSRLKKSTEWGNLEDAILKLNNDSGSSAEQFNLDTSDGDIPRTFSFGSKSPEFDALVNKINEIRQESPEIKNNGPEQIEALEKVVDNTVKISEIAIKPERKIKNQIWPSSEEISIETTKVNGLHSPTNEVTETPAKYISDNNEISQIALPKEVEGPKPTQSSTNEEITLPLSKSVEISQDFLYSERLASCNDMNNISSSMEDTNISDDIKVSRHSLGSLERQKPEISGLDSFSNVSNITINDKIFDKDPKNYTSFDISFNDDPRKESSLSTSELYTTAIDETIKLDKKDALENISFETPDLVRSINEVTIEGPTSLTLEIPGEIVEVTAKKTCTDVINEESGEKEKRCTEDPSRISLSPECSLKSSSSTLTYITEIQVTPNSSTNKSNNVSEIEIIPTINTVSQNLDNKFENYVKNFESSIETSLPSPSSPSEPNSAITNEKIDLEKERNKILEIAEEQLKKLPEMRFTTSSYEGTRTPEKRQSQIELLRSNFEKSPPKTTKAEVNTSKSRIPIATTMKTPPMSPERRDSRNLDLEPDKDILSMMASSIHSTPSVTGLKYQSKSPSKNVTVTSIRSNSKIPSGLPSLSGSRPPVPPRKIETHENENVYHVSANGATENNSFKQWVFNPSNSVTNIVVSENKNEK